VKRLTLLFGVCCLVAVGGCGSDDDKSTPSTSTSQAGSGDGTSTLPTGSEPVDLDPADFTTNIDNPYWPMETGSMWVYRGTEGGEPERIEVTVTNDTKKIDGVTSRVVSDVVTGSDGQLIEKTSDFYAQDSAGNIWYMGEDTKEYENGKVSSTEGSWLSGVKGAEAGIIMPAKPRVGLTYRQEYYKGEAEDAAEVIGLNGKAKVPFGTFADLLVTRDFTPLEPKIEEHKFYAKNTGPVLKTTAKGGSGREELISFSR
jgi:hypothetical protein